MTTFFKGVLVADLKSLYIPGTITRSFREALKWKERIESNKSKGAARYSRKGKACVIQLDIDTTNFKDHAEFQKSGLHEHEYVDCWTSSDQTKAQVNSVCDYKVLTESDLDLLYSLGG